MKKALHTVYLIGKASHLITVGVLLFKHSYHTYNFPVNKFIFNSLKICPKTNPRLYMGQKLRLRKVEDKFCVAIAYLKENSNTKDKFFKKILTQK